ncbi:hypothetical protein CBB_A0051 [Clostridium botulinum Bf]|nr:hypothetical protein CBB_A0051 [Clostridium botulinum Bf]
MDKLLGYCLKFSLGSLSIFYYYMLGSNSAGIIGSFQSQGSFGQATYCFIVW